MPTITDAKISISLLNQVLNYILSQPTNRPTGEVVALVTALQQLPVIEPEQKD